MSGSDLCISRNETARPRYFQNRIIYPNVHINVSVSDLYIPRICLTILLQPNRQRNPGNIYKSLTDTWDVGIRNEAERGIHESDFRYCVG